MKANVLYSIVGVIGGFIATMFGGWSEALITLIIFMSVDYVTGIIVAGIFKKSKKSESDFYSRTSCEVQQLYIV